MLSLWKTNQNLTFALPLPASPSLSGCTTAQKNRIVANLIAAATVRERVVTGATHEDQARSHRQWIKYLDLIILSHDPFLNRLNRCQQKLLICAFTTAYWEGRFSSNAFETLAAGTVRNTISSICLTFWEHGRPNLSKDEDLQSCILLQQLYRSYINNDPKQKQQKAIPLCIIAEIAKQKNTELQQAIGQLTTVAIFFAIRSCECLKVTQAKKRQTDILHLCNLHFFTDDILIEHNNPHLKFFDCISITFEIWDAEEGQEKQHSHANVVGGHQHVPGQDGSSHCPQNQILQRINTPPYLPSGNSTESTMSHPSK